MFSQSNYFDGHWTIVYYPQHPQCVGCQFQITRDAQNPYLYHLHTQVANVLNCAIEYNPVTHQWKPNGVRSTRMLGPSELMAKEYLVTNLISSIRKMKVRDEQLLIIKTNSGEQVQLKRSRESNHN